MTEFADLDKYQVEARKTAIYPELGGNICYPTLGLAGESGEVAEIVKKVYRDYDGILTPNNKAKLGLELGDVLWYIANLASELGYSLSEIAEVNLGKLTDRQSRGKIHGSGDTR